MAPRPPADLGHWHDACIRHGKPTRDAPERMPMPMASVIEINDIRDLAQIQMAWKALLSRTSGATFFQTQEWLELYWQHFGEGQKLRVLVVTACGKPIGIVPLCVREERFRVGNLRVLNYPLHNWGTWFGPIGPNPAATMFMAMRHLHATSADWDLLELRWTSAVRSDRGRTFRAMASAGFRPQKAHYDTTAVVDLTIGKEAYWQGRTSHWRNNLSRDQKRLSRLGDWEYIRHRPLGAAHGDGDPRWDLYDGCCEAARQSWQGQHESGTTLTSAPVASFLRQAHQVAARLGMLDMNLLLLDGQPAAFAYNYHYDGRIQGLRAGFDARLTRVGPGSVLLWQALEDSFRRGDSEYDLGTGGQAYKARVATGTISSYRFTHYRRLGVRSQGVRIARWLKSRVRERSQQSESKSESTKVARSA